MILEIVIVLTLIFILPIYIMLAKLHAKQWERYGDSDTASLWKPTRRRVRKHAFSGRPVATTGKGRQPAHEPRLSSLWDEKDEKRHDSRFRPGEKHVVSNGSFRSNRKT
jgi:hypothetical protein